MERKAVVRLPRSSELGAPALGFLEGRFRAREDLHMSTDLAYVIDRQCSQTEADLHGLKRKLGSSIVSWSCRSVHARASVYDLTLNLENLTLLSSKYENSSLDARKIRKILAQDLPFIVKELKRIKALREYAESALKLEALVGDLEDAVFCALNRHTVNDPSSKHANVMKAVEAIKISEDILLNIAKFHPCWCNLLKTVDSRIGKILSVLRPQVLADHRAVLASLGWPPKVLTSRIEGGVSSIPNPLVLMQRDKRERYSQNFLALCALQHVQKRRDDRPLSLLGKNKDDFVALWAIDELVSPIASRIEHHFLKWTDKPELMFALVYKIIRDFIEGVDDVLQPLIDKARLVSCSAKEAWVSSMVQVLSIFLVKRVFPVLVARYREKCSKEDAISSWLHLIDNIIAFDKRVQSLLRSETFMELSTSISVLSLFHDRPDWLHTWAKVEVKDGWKKLKSELMQERAWFTEYSNCEADHYLLSNREDFKAPPIAEFALKIAWDMIQRCQTFPIMSAKVQFIRSGAVKFLWHFFNVLLLRFQKTDFPAYDSEEALVRVCRLINIARFCESKLQEWSEDVNFLELGVSEKGFDDDLFFDKEIRSLADLETNWLSEIVAQILRQFGSYSHEYLENVLQFEPETNDSAALVVSEDLGEALDNLRGQLMVIRKHLNGKDLLDLWRSVADGLDRFVFRSIISSNARLSNRGEQQIETDMNNLFLVFRSLCTRPEAFFPYIRDLLKALKLDREDVEYLESIEGSDQGSVRKWLLDHGVSTISVDQVLLLLRNRTIH